MACCRPEIKELCVVGGRIDDDDDDDDGLLKSLSIYSAGSGHPILPELRNAVGFNTTSSSHVHHNFP